MSMTIEELLKNLTESGLLSADELSTVQKTISSLGGGASVEKVARELVRRKVLTKLQAAAVMKGKTKNLVFGDYVVLEKIGSGGMGQVFKARHKPTGKQVAVKVLSAEAVKNRRLVARFKKEAKAVARLKHPNVVRAYDSGKINRVRFLVMEFVEGENMLERVKRKGPLPIDECVSCVLQAARGLDYAHQKGIFHRDIKPSNLLRNRRNGRVKVLDMGLARVEEPEEDDEARLTGAGQMLGTARFMAPEQIEDARKADVRSDIYSLGCTMHFMLRAKAPYSGETVAHTLMAHVSAPVPDLCKKRDAVPGWLGEVFQKMLAKNPRHRFQTMAELIQVVQFHLGEELTKHDSHVLDDDAEKDDEYSKLLAQRDVSASLEYLYIDPDESAPDSKENDFGPPPSDVMKGSGFSGDEIPVHPPKQAGFTPRQRDTDPAPEPDDDFPDAGDLDAGGLALQDSDDQPDPFPASTQFPADEVDFEQAPETVDPKADSGVGSAQAFELEQPAATETAEPDTESSPAVEADNDLQREPGGGMDYVKARLKTLQGREMSRSRHMQLVGGVSALIIAIAVGLWLLLQSIGGLF